MLKILHRKFFRKKIAGGNFGIDVHSQVFQTRFDDPVMIKGHFGQLVYLEPFAALIKSIRKGIRHGKIDQAAVAYRDEPLEDPVIFRNFNAFVSEQDLVHIIFRPVDSSESVELFQENILKMGPFI